MTSRTDEAHWIERINSFPRWHYQFNLRGHLTPIFSKGHINRHAQRKKYFFDPLVQFYGGSLKGKRVLDLGCNAGFWSLLSVQAGCDFVLGIDGRQMHIDQANLVFEAHEIEKPRYAFIKDNIFKTDLTKWEKFDIVLFLGLLYHINKPVELLEKISQINTEILVIDTQVARRGGSYFEVLQEPCEEPRNAIDQEMIFHPTKQAVLALANQFGYAPRMLKPAFSSYEDSYDYLFGYRRAFYCAKKALPDVPEESIHLITAFRDFVLWQLLIPLFGLRRLLTRTKRRAVSPD